MDKKISVWTDGCYTGWIFTMIYGIIVPQLALDEVRPEEGVGDEGAGELPRLDVLLYLETQLVPGEVLLQVRGVRRVEPHLEPHLHLLQLLGQLAVVLDPDPHLVLLVVESHAEVILLEKVDVGGHGVDELRARGLAADVDLERGAVQQDHLHYHLGAGARLRGSEHSIQSSISVIIRVANESSRSLKLYI